MNTSDYFIKVNFFAYVHASIGAPMDDENLMAVTLNELGKDYN
jgi:hypothetical protein